MFANRNWYKIRLWYLYSSTPLAVLVLIGQGFRADGSTDRSWVSLYFSYSSSFPCWRFMSSLQWVGAIGALTTIGLVILTAVVGSTLVRHPGAAACGARSTSSCNLVGCPAFCTLAWRPLVGCGLSAVDTRIHHRQFGVIIAHPDISDVSAQHADSLLSAKEVRQRHSCPRWRI